MENKPAFCIFNGKNSCKKIQKEINFVVSAFSLDGKKFTIESYDPFVKIPQYYVGTESLSSACKDAMVQTDGKNYALVNIFEFRISKDGTFYYITNCGYNCSDSWVYQKSLDSPTLHTDCNPLPFGRPSSPLYKWDVKSIIQNTDGSFLVKIQNKESQLYLSPSVSSCLIKEIPGEDQQLIVRLVPPLYQ